MNNTFQLNQVLLLPQFYLSQSMDYSSSLEMGKMGKEENANVALLVLVLIPSLNFLFPLTWNSLLTQTNLS